MAVAAPGAQGLAVHSPAVTRGEEVGSGAAVRSTNRRAGGKVRQRWAAVVVLAFGGGLLAAWLAPRGPVTAGQALGLIALGLVTGGLAGWLARSRWAMLVGPLAHVAAFELGRLSVVGPTVEGIRLD